MPTRSPPWPDRDREVYLAWIRAENARERAAEARFRAEVVYHRILRTLEQIHRRRAAAGSVSRSGVGSGRGSR